MVATADGKRTLTVVLPAFAVPKTFVLKKDDAKPSPDSGVAIVPQGPNLEVKVDGKPFTVHHVDVGAKPFLFPLVGPTGDSYTRAFPMEKVEGEDQDHPHQRSFWFTHGSVNGVDFWSELKNHGTIKETERKVEASSPAFGRIMTHDDWLGPDSVKICEDERVLTVYNTDRVRSPRLRGEAQGDRGTARPGGHEGGDVRHSGRLQHGRQPEDGGQDPQRRGP